MEIYCSKKIGQNGILEYKMTSTKSEHSELGSFNQYGLRVKYCSPVDFDYYSIESVASKPQTVLQIIKYLFDKNVMPDKVYSNVESFLKSV